MNRELQKQISVLMVCRAFLLSALLLSGLLIGRLFNQPLLGSRYYYLLIGAGFGLTILYTLLHPLWSRGRVAASVQTAGDIILVTGFVWVTGGIESPFSLIYFLPIIAAGIMLSRAGAMSAATGAWLMYGFLVVLLVHGWIPNISAAGGAAVDAASMNKRVAYALFSHFLGFFTVAHLASYLSVKLKAAGDELQQKREVLAKVQALNKNIIDSITSGIVTTGLDGRITFINHGAEEITGVGLDQTQDAAVASFLGCREGFVETLNRILSSDRRHRFEASTKRPDGTTIHLGVSAAVLKDQRSHPLGYVFSFQDLTEIKALEDEIRFKDRMAALGGMAAAIAHEIRNPLASMSGSAQLLLKSRQTSDEEAELLDIIVRESRRLDGIISNFLLFARPRRFTPEPVDVVPILQDALRLLESGGELAQQHRVSTEFPAGGVQALVDVDQLRQIFWNLSRNALKAMPDGGTLTVKARQEGPETAVIAFADSGVGMSEEEIDRAFLPFEGSFRGGTGLGLSVVFRIVQQHRGRIRVMSRPGEGTEVTVTLPAARQAGHVTPGGMNMLGAAS